MGHYDNLKEMLCKELKKFDRKQSVNDSDLETLQLLTDIIKNIDKIEILEEDGGYSQAGDWEMEGRGSYSRENSYRRRDSRGRYSRDRYSRSGDISEQLERMMRNAKDPREQEAIQKAMDMLEQE